MAYWIYERHRIHLIKSTSKPWTLDPILRNYFFTNPFRENDKVTKWFAENIREPLRRYPEVLFATIAFRWYNHIEMGAELLTASHRGNYETLEDETFTVCGNCRVRCSVPDICLECGHPNFGLLTNWCAGKASEIGRLRQEKKKTIVGAAYMIKVYNGIRKIRRYSESTPECLGG